MVEKPRGTRDFDPEEMAKMRYVEEVMTRVSDTFGFQEISTPTFEDSELFVMRSGPEIVEQMYVFKDKKNRELALRPELTASVVRFYLDKLRSYPKPLKLYYFGNCFRYERPQKGRFREFFQYGSEMIGGATIESDAEIIALAMTVVKELGLKSVDLRVGNIGILRKILEGSSDVLECLRMISTERFDDLTEFLAKDGLEGKEETILSLVKLKGEGALQEAGEIVGSEVSDQVDYLDTLGQILGIYGIEEVRYEPAMVRGLDYYTGMVFEVDCPNLGAEKQICGGGSYSLADLLGGKPVFSTGFAFGIDRVIMALEEDKFPFPKKTIEAYIIPIAPMRIPATEILKLLRDNGISSDIDLVGRGPSKNLDYANSIGAKNAVFVGEEEWDRKSVSVKDMETGTQTDVLIDELVDFLKKK
jgi:histidyl-tRNA synthetase